MTEPVDAWTLAEQAVDLVEKYNALPWWAWWRRRRACREMVAMTKQINSCRDALVRLFGDRLS